MDSHSGSIEAGGFYLRYQIEGVGTPTIVIGSARKEPRLFSQHLREHLRLVFLDHRGFAVAPSPIDPTSFALETLVDDIERARQALGLERVAVIGHSGHAYMALEYGKKYTAHVSHVVMIGIAPDLSAASQQAAERYWQESVSPDRKAVFQANLQRLPDDALARLPATERARQTRLRNAPKIWFDPHFDETPRWEGVEGNEVIRRVWDEVFPAIDITRGLETFHVPVFLALGRYDFLVAPPSSWDPIRPHFRDLTVRVFERSGHTPCYEEPDLFDADLLSWMKKY
jgi:pimeloyl-ACP methyl ester carboxylesterase